YYGGFAFWARGIPFFAVEAAIIILPLFKGFGNKAQGHAAIGCEFLLIALALAHTYLVSDASITKLQAGKTKTHASADFQRAHVAPGRAAKKPRQPKEPHARLQQNYSKQMLGYNEAARRAAREGMPVPSAPKAPEPPQLQDVPKVGQSLVDNATLSV